MRVVTVDHALIAVTIIALTGAGYFALPRAVSAPPAVKPAAPISSGIDTVAVVLVSSTCGACKREPALSQFKSDIAMLVEKSPTFLIIGIADDVDVTMGVQFLEELADFDEINTGSGWRNMGLLRYLWADSTGVPEVPQMLVIVRTTHVDSIIPGGIRTSERVADRAIGLEAMSVMTRRLVQLQP